jgi:hypothetical protein
MIQLSLCELQGRNYQNGTEGDCIDKVKNRKRVGTKLGNQLGTMHDKIDTIGKKLKNKLPKSG